MKQDKKMIVAFIVPAVISFLIFYLYPVVRTVVMSFFDVPGITASISEWGFTGIDNYVRLWDSPTFRAAMQNIGLIWLCGGVAVLAISLLFAVVLSSGIRGKSFFRAVVYLPNIVSAVALATMWKQFVFVNNNYGLMKSAWKLFGFANVNWLGTQMLFWSMLIAFSFGGIGYYMLIFLSGIERIPTDIFEAATIDGAGKGRQFRYITLPLLTGTIRTNLTFWSINTITFFVWSKMFSPITTDLSTVTPMVYMYDITFGMQGNSSRWPGGGAAIGVVMSLMVLCVFFVFNRLLKDDGLEF